MDLVYNTIEAVLFMGAQNSSYVQHLLFLINLKRYWTALRSPNETNFSSQIWVLTIRDSYLGEYNHLWFYQKSAI